MRIVTFNVHMWSDRDGRSTTQATIDLLRSLLDRLDDLPDVGPVLLAGDLNAVRLADYNVATLKGIRAQRAQRGLELPMGDVTARLEASGWIDLWREARALGPEKQQVASGDCARYGHLGRKTSSVVRTRRPTARAGPFISQRPRSLCCATGCRSCHPY